MPRVIAALVRHGNYHQLPDTPSAHQPFPLNTEGEKQAQQGVELLYGDLRTNGWIIHPVIDSSRLLRGWQTACILADGLAPLVSNALYVEGSDDLAERGLGSGANLTVAAIEAILERDPRYELPPSNWKSNSQYRLPLQGAESLLEAGARVAEHLTSRMRALRDEVAKDTCKLFVGHGAAFRHAAYQLGMLTLDQVAQLSMYHVQPVYLEFRPDGSWRHVAGEWKVRTANEALD